VFLVTVLKPFLKAFFVRFRIHIITFKGVFGSGTDPISLFILLLLLLLGRPSSKKPMAASFQIGSR